MPLAASGSPPRMSKHFFRTEIDGQKPLVDAGWDRPLGHHYLNIEREDASEEDALLYSSLTDRALYNPERGRLMAGLTVEELAAKLTEHGITPPDGFLTALEEDARKNVGNAIRN
ncbi:hypothetical protein F8S09_15060 [Deinococcus sp. SDU3-2]|uniref:Uncharacterized protein n=1 Tax=Deinococcus terrestris TaxID=2651870 RepID=A0A7X1NZ40_9DEIO|nr:hypothetical protein [Deinococcus terrestris]MPY67979.1 hypothetical protein [Deinococcus terrestris]